MIIEKELEKINKKLTFFEILIEKDNSLTIFRNCARFLLNLGELDIPYIMFSNSKTFFKEVDMIKSFFEKHKQIMKVKK